MKINGKEYTQKYIKLLIEEHDVFKEALYEIKSAEDLEDAKAIAYIAINNEIWEG